MRNYFFCAVFAFFFLTSCNAPPPRPQIDYYNLPAFNENGVNMVVEIPAGAAIPYKYDPEKKDFTFEQENGKPGTVDFLPYPANYGFIPSTYADTRRESEAGPLDVILMCAAQPTGELISIKPIGLLELIDQGEVDMKLIAIPSDTVLQAIQPRDFQDFIIRYDGARRIIETWFLQYKGIGQTRIKAWQDEKAAMAEIKKRAVQQ